MFKVISQKDVGVRVQFPPGVSINVHFLLDADMRHPAPIIPGWTLENNPSDHRSPDQRLDHYLQHVSMRSHRYNMDGRTLISSADPDADFEGSLAKKSGKVSARLAQTAEHDGTKA